MTSGTVVFAAWMLTCATLVIVGALTQSVLAWLAGVVASAATALTLLGLAQAPERTIAEIIHDAEQQ